MRLNFLRLFFFINLFLFSETINAQNCRRSDINGTTINLLCNQVCSTLVFQLPHLKGTTDYLVKSIPFNPFAFTTPGGTIVPEIYVDDTWSGVKNIGFNFCYYGNVYPSLIMGSNSAISFDISRAGSGSGYAINAATGAIPNTTYAPSMIFGPYHDIDPSDPSANKKIEYRVECTAPFRRFIASYNDMPYFGTSCPTERATHQMVLYESTGIVEIYVKDKPACTGWNGGLAILGMQDATRTRAIAPIGKNATVWSENNTAYQFIPSGGTSRYLLSELLDMTGSVVSTADTSTTVAGLLDIAFTNFCPPAGNNQFAVRTTFTDCINPANLYTTLDTITINRTNSLNAIGTSTNTSCGPPSGTITVTVPAGIGTPPYTFILDGGAPVVAPSPYTFTGVSSGSHTIVVTDASAGCTSTLNVTVNLTNGITANTTSSATACAGVANGTITVTPTSGTAPYTYSLDGAIAVPGPSPFTFSNLTSGSHTIVVRDASGCVSSVINVTVAVGPGITANATQVATSCTTATNGSITINATVGTAPFTFQLDGGTPQTGASPYTFTNISSGAHTVLVTDNLGCTRTLNINVTAGAPIITTANKTDALCNGSATGTITVTQPIVGTPPFEYSLDGTTWQTSNVFNGLTAGTYTVYFREGNGCQNNLSITVAEPTRLAASSAFVPVVCNGENNSIITITSAGGIAPYQYSMDGGTTWQSSNVFNTAAGSHTVIIRDANNCITTQIVNVTEPAALNVSSANGPASCDGGNDGVINVSVTGGNSGYEYSIDGGATWQPGNIFNTGPGNFTITVRDNLGCNTSFPTTVALANNLTLIKQTDPTICEGTSTQLELVSSGAQFAWSPATALSNTTIYNPIANPTVTTEYIVITILGRCSANDTVIVNVNPAPIPDAGTDAFICYGQTYQLQASNGTVYQWTPTTYLSNPTIANPISTPIKDITYTLSILSDINGCASLTNDEIYIDVTPPIKVKTFPFDTIGYSGDQFQILAVPNDTDVINYTWTPAKGLSDTGIPNPIVTLGLNGDVVQYKVATSTIAGCIGEGFVTVRVYKGPDIYVPTAFSPNDDGRNDKFLPIPVGIKSLNYFRVYNRWGQLLFSTNKLHDGWDGKISNVKQGSGVFVWMIEGVTNNNRIITKKGTVTLIR